MSIEQSEKSVDVHKLQKEFTESKLELFFSDGIHNLAKGQRLTEKMIFACTLIYPEDSSSFQTDNFTYSSRADKIS